MAKTIGEILKEIRLDRELSIIDVANETHIRAKYIEALENDQLSSFPSAVHGRGFLRLYAEVLDLPSGPLLDAWDGGLVDESLFFPHRSRLPDQGDAKQAHEETIETATRNASAVEVKEHQDQETQERTLPVANQLQLDDSSESFDIFLEIGQTLKKQRESLGLSLNDIEQYTHIRMFHLQSIEAGRINELPSTVQGKGMIESYAQFLDIDADALMLRFADGLQTKREERFQTPAKPVGNKKPESKSKRNPTIRKLITPDLLIGSIVIVSLVVFAVWSTSKVIASRNQNAQETIPAISEMLAATSSNTPLSENFQTFPTETVSIEISPGVGEANNSDSTPITVSLSTADTSTTIPFADNLPLQVYIVARQRAYLKVIVDDTTAYDGRITPGNALPFSGNDKIEILTGNASALQILFNEIDLGTIGTFGQVIDLILTKQGVITPTPRFTPTATQTIPATITLEPTSTPETPTITPLIP